MKRALIIISLLTTFIGAQPPPPPRWFMLFFQIGFNDTAYVDTMEVCSKCSPLFNCTSCTSAVVLSMGADTDSTDDYWYGFYLRFFIYDSSADTVWDSCGIHDSCSSVSIPLWRVQPCPYHMAPTCSTVWGYHLWIIDISSAIYPDLAAGDSLCVYITKGSLSGRKCIAYNPFAIYQRMRLIIPDSTSLVISNESNIIRKVYQDGRFDLRGRRLHSYLPPIYIEDGKVKINLR